MNAKKLLSLVLALTLILGASGAMAQAAAYPIAQEGVTLTCWMPLSPAASKYITTMGESPAWQEYQKRIGVTIEFIHPTPNQEREQFNLLIASNNLPDILYFPQAYQGGAFQGMRDGLFQDITDLLPTYAPDYYKLIAEDQEFFREVSDNDGRIVAFCGYKPQGDPPARRILFKEDVLKQLDASVPKTLAEYEALFEKMKAAGITPYLPVKNINGVEMQFAGMYGIYAESTDANGIKFMKDENGMVKLAQIEPGFRQYLALMNDWYQKGYISKDFTSVDEQQANTLFDSGAVGMIIAPCVAAYNRGQNQGFSIVTAPYPRLQEGDKLHYEFLDIWPNMNRMETTAVITKDCKNVEAAVQFMNYAYSEAGAELLNWGVEGLNWNWVDGKRVYNDTMLKNEMFGTEEASYIYKAHLAPKLTYMDTECHANLLKSPGALAVRMAWADDPDVDTLYQLPPFQLSADAQARRAEIMNDVTIYCNEMVLKFIIGTEPIENFDQYVQTLKGMGVEEAVALTQEAYDAYMSKGQ